MPKAIYLLYLLTKYRILTDCAPFQVPKRLKILGLFAHVIFYPVQFSKGKPKNSELGERLAKLFQSLGPIYIKFGQSLSTRPDLIGDEIAESLKFLQDKLPPFDSKIAKSRIEQTFGRKMNEIFEIFEDIPVAAASIAQVHKAKLKSGEWVAVKILRPNIAQTYEEDIAFLEYGAEIIARYLKKSKRLKPREIMSLFRQSMKLELDLRLEAAASSRIRDNFAADYTLHVPRIHWQLTDTEIMTLEWIEGVSIYDRSAIESFKLDPKEIAGKIAVIFFNQAYRDGFFHADLHPGNIMVRKDGNIVLVDFGIIGILGEEDRLAIAEILYAFLKKDYMLVAEVHKRAGYIPYNTNLEYFAQSCRSIAEPIIGLSVSNISIGNLLSQLFKITEEYGMETQIQLLLLQKTMVMVEGIGQSLDPDINMWQLAEPWIKKWAAKNLSPEAKILRMIKKFFKKMA